MNAFGGKVSVDSSLGEGTSIKITFPELPELNQYIPLGGSVDAARKIVLIDDDHSIHKYLLHRVGQENFVGFKSLSDFETAYASNSKQEFFFVDYNFWGEDKKGTELILGSKLFHKENTVLLTSDFYLPEIQMFALKTGVKVLPKQLLSACFQ